MTRLLAISLLAMLLAACNNKNVRNDPAPDDPCRTSKGKLDDFGPGVERCREQRARELDDVGERR